MKKNLKFILVLWLAKLSSVALKIIRRDATYFPGKLAVTLCPDFLGRIDKPEKIIGVTGTNGKTTVTNMIGDVLKANGYKILTNNLGANVNSGIATTLIQNSTLFGRCKKQYGVLEIDERSAKKIYPYVEPDFLVCTNLFRDSSKRNAHTEFIVSILNSAIPEKTKLILNGDDLIASNIAPKNDRVYFGIDKLDTDMRECINIARDIIVCPECSSTLEYDFVRYNHIGKAHCPNCKFKSPKIDYKVTKLDLKSKKMTLKSNKEEFEYSLITNNIINIYNMLAAITALKEFGMQDKKINRALRKTKIVETRFSEEKVKSKKIVMHLAKGQNPIACSRVFDYVKKEPGRKAVILLLDDLHDAENSSENISWLYDTDFEFLSDSSIKQIIVSGARYLDDYVRLLMADVQDEKIVYARDELEAANEINVKDVDSIYILHDLYAIELAKKVKTIVKNKVLESGNKKQRKNKK